MEWNSLCCHLETEGFDGVSKAPSPGVLRLPNRTLGLPGIGHCQMARSPLGLTFSRSLGLFSRTVIASVALPLQPLRSHRFRSTFSGILRTVVVDPTLLTAFWFCKVRKPGRANQNGNCKVRMAMPPSLTQWSWKTPSITVPRHLRLAVPSKIWPISIALFHFEQ
jgi:hypothetical protein